MTILSIIGNGFDLYHGLPTGHTNFYTYITHNKQGREFVRTIERIIEKSPRIFWKDFESNLGNITLDHLYFSSIAEWYPHATWTVTYHGDAEDKLRQLKKLGISDVKLITMEQYEKM